MRIITEIAGAAENKIVYESDGKVGVFVLPSLFSMDETRRRLIESVRGETPLKKEEVPKKETMPEESGTQKEEEEGSRKAEEPAESAKGGNARSGARRKPALKGERS